jgi:hypothetical protein
VVDISREGVGCQEGVEKMEQDKVGASKRDEREAETGAAGEKGQRKASEGLGNGRKRARLLECLGNLNALNKVQGALLSQMEREIE